MKYIKIVASLVITSVVVSAQHEPQELIKLRLSYQSAQERVLTPLMETYISQLQSLKNRLTKSGKLEDALQIDAELKKVLSVASGKSGTSYEHLLGEWICNGVETDVFMIKVDGTTYHFADKGSWKFEEGILTITWENPWRNVISASQTGDTIYVKNYAPGSTNYSTLEFTRKSKPNLNDIEKSDPVSSEKSKSGGNFRQLVGIWEKSGDPDGYANIFEFKLPNTVMYTNTYSTSGGGSSTNTSEWEADEKADKIILEDKVRRNTNDYKRWYEIKIPFDLDSLEITHFSEGVGNKSSQTYTLQKKK